MRPLQQAHRLKAIFAELCADYGGTDALSTLQRGPLRQATIVMLRCEQTEIAIERGEPFDEEEHRKNVAISLRVLSRLGARAKAPAPPEETLEQYIRRVDAEAAEQPRTAP